MQSPTVVRLRALRRRIRNRWLSEVPGRLRPVRTVDGVVLRLGSHVAPPIQAKIMDGSYEAPERQALREVLRDGDRVLDIGAGLGFLSALCALRLGSSSVHSVEANPALAPIIEHTFSDNGVCPTLHSAIVDVGDDLPTDVEFFVHDEFWRSSTVRPTRGGVTSIRVPVISASELFRTARPSLLILDIEGGEADLLPKLPLRGVGTVVVETHPRVIGQSGLQRVEDALLGQGYEIEALPGDVWVAQR